jgi:hypothetical protein
MQSFKYGNPSELYYHTRRKRPGSLTYRRFATAAEAIRFAMENVPPADLAHCYLDIEGERYEADQLRELYASAEYPLKRGE